MAVADLHPDIADLEAFTLGTLNDAALADIEEHVANCPRCQEQAAQTAGDSLVELLRRAHERSVFARRHRVPDRVPRADASSGSGAGHHPGARRIG